MVLAGGKSTRLYPLTLAVPKPNVPIAGEPNVAHVLRYLRAHGIEDIAINVHYLADQVRAAFGDGSRYGVRLEYLDEQELMGSAGAVKAMERFFPETFVVVGCDDLTDIPLDELIAFHRDRGAIATIGLVHADDVEHYGVVIVNEDGRIREFQEKPTRGTERSHLVNTGIYVFDPQIFKHIAANEFVDFGKNVFPGILASGERFFGKNMQGSYWCDIGTPSEYRRANFDVVTGRLALSGVVGDHRSPSAAIAPGVSIEGAVRIGAATTVAAGARLVGPCVIGERCTIGPGAYLERTIVWDDAAIGAGARLCNAIVGAGTEVDPGASIEDDIVAAAAAGA